MELAAFNIALRFGAAGSALPPALDIDRLSAAPGVLTVVTGPSGSGKSSLLYVLGGLLAAPGSHVRWGETDIAGMDEGARDRWRRQNAGFVFQNFHLIPEMSALENVVVGAYFHRFSSAPWRARAEELLDQLEVPGVRRQAGTHSRGEQQRIAMARALLFDPPVILADEPTASLDTESAERLADHLHLLAGEGHRTVIAVSHDAALIDRAGALIRLEHGRIAEVLK